MRRIFLMALLTTALLANAQEKRFRSVAMNDEQLLFGFHSNLWKGLPEYVDQRLINQSFSIHLLYDRPIGLSNFSFATGLGWLQQNLHSNAYPVKDMLLGEGRTVFYLIPTQIGLNQIEYSRNKVSFGYLNVPVEFRYRNRTDLKFKFTMGMSASVLLNSYIDYRGNDIWGNPEEIVRIKRFRVPNAAPWVYSVHARIGVRQWGLQVRYQIPSSFKTGLGPEIRPLGIGLTYNPA